MKKMTLILSLVASLNSFADYTGECASSLKPFVKDLEVDMRVNSRIVLTELDGASINGTSLDRSDDLEIVEVGVDDKILEQGILDSPAIIKLILFIEKKYKVTIEENEMNIDSFSSINQIEKLIKSKIG